MNQPFGVAVTWLAVTNSTPFLLEIAVDKGLPVVLAVLIFLSIQGLFVLTTTLYGAYYGTYR